jgi:GTP-binding protein
MRQEWQRSIETYLNNNEQLKLVFLLLDSRHGILENDRLMINWLEYYNVTFTLVLTKSDKISNNKYRIIKTKLGTEYPNRKILKFSSKNKTGREDILHILEQIVQ